MGRIAETHGWTRGCGRPAIPGVYEIDYMGRRMLVNVKRDRFPGLSGKADLRVYCVPGHMKEGLPISDFNMYCMPRSDDSRRSAASNLGEYDRATSRLIAGVIALHAVVWKENEKKNVEGKGLDNPYSSFLETLKEDIIDVEGVKKAVEERLGVWEREDHEAIPLPSEGPGAPPKGKDLHGRDV